jgi:hypothetical protein
MSVAAFDTASAPYPRGLTLAALGAAVAAIAGALLASLWVLSAYYLALWWIARSVQRAGTASGAAQ